MRRHNQGPSLRRPCAGWRFWLDVRSSSGLARPQANETRAPRSDCSDVHKASIICSLPRRSRKSLAADATYRVASAILPLLDGMEQKVVQCVPICYRRNLTEHALGQGAHDVLLRQRRRCHRLLAPDSPPPDRRYAAATSATISARQWKPLHRRFHSLAAGVSRCFRALVKLCCMTASGWQTWTHESKLDEKNIGRTGGLDEQLSRLLLQGPL